MQTNHIINKFENLSRKFFFFVGISIFLTSVISELFLFDGKIGSPLIVLFSVSLSWIIYPFVPAKLRFPVHSVDNCEPAIRLDVFQEIDNYASKACL